VEECGGFGIPGVYLVGGGDVPSARSGVWDFLTECVNESVEGCLTPALLTPVVETNVA
jgi:hypothetical protein